VYNPLWKRPV